MTIKPVADESEKTEFNLFVRKMAFLDQTLNMLHTVYLFFLSYLPPSAMHQLSNHSNVAVFNQNHDFTPKEHAPIFVLSHYYCLSYAKNWNAIRIAIFPFSKMVVATVVDEKCRSIDVAFLEMFACYEMVIIVKVHYATTLKMAILNFSLV